jgi:hypothetical protein
LASEIARQDVGKNWAGRFMSRHSNNVIIKYTQGMDNCRKRADSAFKYSLYFDLLEHKIKQYNVQQQLIYNMDEKGFLIGILSKQKRIFSKARYELGGLRQAIQDGNREWITSIACICADGSWLPPGLIYQATSGNIQDTWLQDFDPIIHKALFASSPSGWTNDQLGLEWLKQFNKATTTKARRQYRLLLLDGHGSHLNMAFINYCDNNKILLALYPPHSTHTLQPLDVCCFRPLSAAYSLQLSNFLFESQGLTAISKRDFFRLFYIAWESTFTPALIKSAFKSTGIYPLNPSIILDKFNLKQQDRPSSAESSQSVLSASDWKKIRALLQEVIEDIDDRESRKLSRELEQLTTRYQILKSENRGLRQALISEKKKRQRGKPLLLATPTQSNRGAIFWSPSKVQQARERQAQKDTEAELQRLQKQEDKILREEKKLEKQRLQEERKRTRATAKEIRTQQLNEKRRQRQEALIQREADRQLQNEVKFTKKTQKKAIKPVVQPHKDSMDEDIDAEAVVVLEPSNRRGRRITLPQRYRT